MNPSKSKDPMEPLRRDPQEIRDVLAQVLKLEAERLYQERPHINDDILRIVKEVIK
jgi:hypothetical protein